MSANSTYQYLGNITKSNINSFMEEKGLDIINHVYMRNGKNLAAHLMLNHYDLFKELYRKKKIMTNVDIAIDGDVKKGDKLLGEAIKANDFEMAKKLVEKFKAKRTCNYFSAPWIVAKYAPGKWKEFLDYFHDSNVDLVGRPKSRGKKKTTTPIQEAHAHYTKNSKYRDIMLYLFDLTEGKCFKNKDTRDQNINNCILRIRGELPEYEKPRNNDSLSEYDIPSSFIDAEFQKQNYNPFIGNRSRLPRYEPTAPPPTYDCYEK